MRTPYRALSVEAVEDRSLPSHSFGVFDPGHAGYSHRAEAALVRFTDSGGYGYSYGFREFQPGTLIRIQFADNSVLFIREWAGGFQFLPVFAGTSTPPPVASTPSPVQGPVGDGATSATGGSSQGGDTVTTPVAVSHGPVRSTAAGAPVPTGDVAVVLPAQSNSAAPPANADQAASAAAQVLVQTNPPAVAVSAQPAAGHGAGYAITAIVPEAEGDDVTPPADPAPMPGPAPTPAPDGDGGALLQVAAAAVAPVAGLVPVDLSALSTGAGVFLGRVADLAPSWPDAMPGFTDTLWVATAALLTGGAAYAANTRSAPRPARDPLAGALSEWERRNGRAAG